MSKKKPPPRPDAYADLLTDVTARIRHAQTRAVLALIAEPVRLCWDIGRIRDARQVQEGYGTAVIPRLARDLHRELPEVKGFSERNIGRMLAFFRAYPDPAAVLPQPVAKPAADGKVPQAVAQLAPDASLFWSLAWGHHAVLIEPPGILRLARPWYHGKE